MKYTYSCLIGILLLAFITQSCNNENTNQTQNDSGNSEYDSTAEQKENSTTEAAISYRGRRIMDMDNSSFAKLYNYIRLKGSKTPHNMPAPEALSSNNWQSIVPPFFWPEDNTLVYDFMSSKHDILYSMVAIPHGDEYRQIACYCYKGGKRTSERENFYALTIDSLALYMEGSISADSVKSDIREFIKKL